MPGKTCSKCQVTKPLSEYWRSRAGRTRDGYKNECKDCAKARRRAWAAANPERDAAHQRRRYEGRRDYYLAQTREWRENNRDQYLAGKRKRQAVRRARKANAFVEEVDPLVVYQMHGGACGICDEYVSPDAFHVDHIIPLSKGGTHSYANSQPAHPDCNVRKGNRE